MMLSGKIGEEVPSNRIGSNNNPFANASNAATNSLSSDSLPPLSSTSAFTSSSTSTSSSSSSSSAIDIPPSSFDSAGPNNSSGSGLLFPHEGTLDEPVTETIMRDLKQIAHKIKHVLIPSESGATKELRNWDLWGPLILCLILACSLSWSSSANLINSAGTTENQSALVFAAVFVIVWCGAGVVTLNAALLGGNISFLQSVCVLGYCLAPLCLASLLSYAWHQFIFRVIIVVVAFLWATKASVGFMGQLVPDNRRALAVYPVLLFYLTIAWMILIQ